MKRRKMIISRVLAVVVSITLIFTMTPAAIAMNTDKVSATDENSEKITGKVLGYVYFGSYPQKEVVSQISESGLNTKSWTKETDYIIDAELYDQLKRAENWDENEDIEITDIESGKNVKYHRLKKSGATYSEDNSNYYYQWTDDSTYHYFKYEPIKWRVLRQEGDSAFLLADTALDEQKYNTSNISCTWETCTLRNWLNSSFLNRAFTKNEQAAINITDVKNNNGLITGTDGGNDTKDKVYLLSESEVCTDNARKYGFVEAYGAYDTARYALSSSYAKAMGVYSYTSDLYLGNCPWWLRSPGRDNSSAISVGYHGDVLNDGSSVTAVDCAVRPALYLDLRSTELYSTENRDVEITSEDVFMKSSHEYDGKEKEPEVIIAGLYEDIDYTVKYSNNINPGTAKVKVTGIGNCSGTVEATFAISLPAQKGSLTNAVNYELVEFGSYPQREVVSEAEVSGVHGKSWTTENDCLVDATLYEQLQVATWDSDNDTTIGGDKYHRLKKDEATYSTNMDDNHYDWADDSTYHYFKYEPIKWRVIDNDEENMFLMADASLDDQRYNNSYSSVTWEKCSLRKWLNSEFLNRAFTKNEQASINTSSVENRDNLEYETEGGNDTQDKVYLLSESEMYTDNAMKYGFDSEYDLADAARRSKSSTYAKAMGVYSQTYSRYLGNCDFWLRSPGNDINKSAFAISNGHIDGSGMSVDNRLNAVRPVVSLNLRTADPKSAGNTGVLKEMNVSHVEIPRDAVVYRGTAITPEVSVQGLTEGKDYEVKYTNNDKQGLATITVTGKGNWTGSITRHFVLADEINISDMTLSIADTETCYNGKPVCPTVSISGLEEEKDFSVTYQKNNEAGKGKVTATGKNGYVGSIEKTFMIYEHDFHHFTVPAQIGKAGKTYDRCSRCSKVINEKPLKALKPATTKITSLKGSKKAFTVKWRKKSYTGYQIRYSLKSSMRSAKAVTITKATTVSRKIRNLKAKKKYYVQVRTYKTVSGKKCYSLWSSKKAVKTR